MDMSLVAMLIQRGKGCSLNIVFFSKILRYIPDSGFSWFPLGVSVCTQWQVKHQHCSRTGIVQKNHNILRKNTIFNEHPVTLLTQDCACNIMDTPSAYLLAHLSTLMSVSWLVGWLVSLS